MEFVLGPVIVALLGVAGWYAQRHIARRSDRERERRLLLAELVANAEALDSAALLERIHPSEIRRSVYEGRREHLAEHLSDQAWALVEGAYRSMGSLPSDSGGDPDVGRHAFDVALTSVNDAIRALGGEPPLRFDEQVQKIEDEIPRLILESQRAADEATKALREFEERVARDNASLPQEVRDFSAAIRAKLEEGVTPAALSHQLRARYGSTLSEEDLVKLDELVLAEDAVVRAEKRRAQRSGQ